MQPRVVLSASEGLSRKRMTSIQKNAVWSVFPPLTSSTSKSWLLLQRCDQPRERVPLRQPSSPPHSSHFHLLVDEQRCHVQCFLSLLLLLSHTRRRLRRLTWWSHAVKRRWSFASEARRMLVSFCQVNKFWLMTQITVSASSFLGLPSFIWHNCCIFRKHPHLHHVSIKLLSNCASCQRKKSQKIAKEQFNSRLGRFFL